MCKYRFVLIVFFLFCLVRSCFSYYRAFIFIVVISIFYHISLVFIICLGPKGQAREPFFFRPDEGPFPLFVCRPNSPPIRPNSRPKQAAAQLLPSEAQQTSPLLPGLFPHPRPRLRHPRPTCMVIHPFAMHNVKATELHQARAISSTYHQCLKAHFPLLNSSSTMGL